MLVTFAQIQSFVLVLVLVQATTKRCFAVSNALCVVLIVFAKPIMLENTLTHRDRVDTNVSGLKINNHSFITVHGERKKSSIKGDIYVRTYYYFY
jgi:hypothetical protein